MGMSAYFMTIEKRAQYNIWLMKNDFADNAERIDSAQRDPRIQYTVSDRASNFQRLGPGMWVDNSFRSMDSHGRPVRVGVPFKVPMAIDARIRPGQSPLDYTSLTIPGK